jgi:hypothetical protein
MPSATCDCGHLACFHVKTAEPSTDKQQFEQLKQRIQDLEQQLDREKTGGLGSMVTRLSGLEDLVDRTREEIGQEIKGSYRNISRVWESVQQVEVRLAGLEVQVDGVEEKAVLQANDLDLVSNKFDDLSNRQLELFDAEFCVLEDRIKKLEDNSVTRSTQRSRHRRKSTSDSLPQSNALVGTRQRRSSASRANLDEVPFIPFRDRTVTTPPATSWTVHISLLPSSTLPFPFEKDTNAYKRCLSRGLHQMVVVAGTDGDAFVEAVNMAFATLLKGRAWMPLEAKLCDAEPLQGLPMLRPLDPKLVGSEYNADFLSQNCAVCDPSGRIDSLYIAMTNDTLSWHYIRHSPIFMNRLEACWAYDHLLDMNDPFDDDQLDEDNRPGAGDIVTNLPSLKRNASEMSRANSFGSSTASSESEGSRPKMPRIPRLVDVHHPVKV